MATRVIWSDAAVSDIDSIADFIAKDSERYAASVVSQILEAGPLLQRFPRIGRVVPEPKNENIREVQAAKNYRIIYEIRGETVFIVSVFHGRRNFGSGL